VTSRTRDAQDDEAENEDSSENPWSNAVQFLCALLGVLLVGITPNPPITARDWVQMLVGATLTAVMTTAAVRTRLLRLVGNAWPAVKKRRWQDWVLVVAALLLAVAVAFAVPLLWDVGRGLSYRAFGCPPATQVRLLAEPETIATAGELAVRYGSWTAADNHGCPTAEVYAYSAEAATIQQKVATTDGWSDASLRTAGPRPDVWLTSTRQEVGAAATPSGPVVEAVPVAHSPLVLAVPVGATRPTGTWPQVFRQLQEAGVAVLRPDPRTTQAGRLATVLLYGRDTTYPDAAGAVAVERSLDTARDAGRIGDAAQLLCPRRTAGTGTATAVVATEQDVARYNEGAALGAACGATPDRPASERRVEAVYPDDTADQEVQLVRLRWADPVPVQERAAEAFGRWLRSDAGRAALVASGLRPAGALPTPAPPLTDENGVDLSLATSPEPVPAARWTDAYAAHEAAQLPSRLLVLVDTSRSMARVVPARAGAPPGRTRAGLAADAVNAGLADLQSRDEFGLRLFPGGTPAAYDDAVPVGPRDDGLVRARDVLARVQSDDDTSPLYRAVTDGVTTLSAEEQTASGEPVGTRALVVLTDGRDSGSGTDLNDAVDRVRDRGVRIVVVALGGLRCAEAGLGTLADATGGECVESDPADVPGRVQELIAQLRGGRS
jgi:hypothetical protein